LPALRELECSRQDLPGDVDGELTCSTCYTSLQARFKELASARSEANMQAENNKIFREADVVKNCEKLKRGVLGIPQEWFQIGLFLGNVALFRY
jgi:hypothetical protein